MPDKPLTLEDLARAEANADAQRQKTKEIYLEGQKRLVKIVPQRFFEVARQIREGVTRFNGAAKLSSIITYTESSGITTRDPNPNADFFLEVRRDINWLGLSLMCFQRAGRPDSFMMNGQGQIGRPTMQDAFTLRVEAVAGETEKDLSWRITSDFKNVDTSLEELPERLVAVVATGELTRLWTMAPFIG